MSDTLKPVSIYTLFAQLFASVAREVTEEFGEAGAEAVRRGVRKYGNMRGQNIAKNAADDGKPNTIENYLPYYDMERSELFVYDTVMGDNLIDQKFYHCPFAKAFIKDGNQEIGKLYCDEIDNAIVFVDKKPEPEILEEVATFFNKKDIQINENGTLNNVQLRCLNEPACHKLIDFYVMKFKLQ